LGELRNHTVERGKSNRLTAGAYLLLYESKHHPAT